jgi:molybdate transport system substrate-binding protein
MLLHRRALLLSGLALPVALAAAHARAQALAPLTVAAASDLRFALDELLRGFRATRPTARVDVVFGSSGKLSAQIQNGAPFDVFFSADLAYAQQLQRLKLVHGEIQPYAVGQLALWSLDAELGQLSLDEVVRHRRVKRFAIANPEHAPYGQRALEALRHRGLLEVAQNKLVLGDNVAQAAQFVQTGAAQAGLVSPALLLSPTLLGLGAWSRLPQAWHSPLVQALVVLRRAAQSALAAELLAHLQTPAVQALWQRYGFSLPSTRATRSTSTTTSSTSSTSSTAIFNNSVNTRASTASGAGASMASGVRP